MGPQQTENVVLVVREDYISTCIQLHKDVVGCLAPPKSQVDNSVHTQLLNRIELFGAEMLSQLHGEARGQVLLVLDVVCRVNADA